MLGRDLQLAAHVVFHELADERVVLVVQRVVESDAAAHEHLLHARQRPQLAQQLQIIRMRDAQLLAGLGR